MDRQWGQRMWFRTGYVAIVSVLAVSAIALATLDLTVFDSSGGADDVAHVLLYYPDASQEDLGYTPQGNVNGRTWNLLADSQILSKGAGTYTLRIIHDADTNADCNTPSDEVRGTYTITFGGGIVVSAVNDSGTATNGQSTTIDVLANDLLVDASAFAFGEIPCPATTPDSACACSTYTGGQCPSTLTVGVNYVEGQFQVTVDDPSLSIQSVGNPPNGDASIVSNEIVYTPDPGFCGIDTFSYTASRSGATDSGTVTVSVSAAPPTPQNDEAATTEETDILIDVLANDGTGLDVIAVTAPSYGQATIVSNEIRYVPRPRFEGFDRFSYTARNSCGGTASAQVEVRVEHVNHPPIASAGTFYQGLVDEPVELNAGFSTDPDLGDVLQYRWDMDDDGTYDTGWLAVPTYAAVYERRYVGRVRVEVRDLYRGLPTGEIATATALIRIDSLQTVQIHVFEDLDGDAVWSEGEPSLEGIEVEIAANTLTTELDGRASIELDAGTWDVALTPAAQTQLEARGFRIVVGSATAVLRASEHVVVELSVAKTSTRLKGVVYADSNENGELDDDDRLVEGIAVVLDGDEEGAVVTDATGAFAFRDVAFGPHEIYVEQTGLPEGETPLNLLTPFTLARTEKAEIHVAWPYDLGPEGGFLQVDVKRGGEE